MAAQTPTTRIGLDGRWDFEELTDTIKSYIQLYGFTYSLAPDLPAGRRMEIEYIYAKFPWKGGYSTVNFFNQLYHNIPPQRRPKVIEIRYASPGFIEITTLASAAAAAAAIVKSICFSIAAAHKLYRDIQKTSVEHELSKVNLAQQRLNLTKSQIEFCESASEKLVNVLGLTQAQNALLDERTDGNKAVKMKLLLSVFRRAATLADKQVAQMLNLPEGPE
jgi:hypothetical protein